MRTFKTDNLISILQFLNNMDINIPYLQSCASASSFHLIGSTLQFRITEIESLWAINPSLLVHTGYRLIGNYGQMLSALAHLGIKVEETNNIVSTAITSENYMTSFFQVYNTEILTYQNMLRGILSLPKLEIPVLGNSSKPSQKPIDVNPFQQAIDQEVDANQFEDTTRDIDIFDFLKYKTEYDMFGVYYQGLEQAIRASAFIKYKYAWLTEESDREILNSEIYTNRNGNARVDLRKYLDLMSGMTDSHQLLWSWYKHYNPSLLWNVNTLYDKWANHMTHFMNKLYKKYVDPTADYTELWL